MLTTVFVARTHSPTIAGEVISQLAIIQLVGLFFTCGLNVALVYYARGKNNRIANLFCVNCYSTVAIGTTASLISFFVFNTTDLALLTCLSATLIALNSSLAAAYQSSERFARLAYLLLAQASLGLPANAISVSLMSGSTTDFVSIYASLMLGTFLIVSFSEGLIGRARACPPSVDKGYFLYGLNAAISNGSATFMYTAEIIVMRSIGFGDFLGLYVVAASISKASWLVADSIGLTVFPRLVRNSILQTEFRQIQIAAMLFPMACLIAWYLIGEILIRLLFGDDYQPASQIVMVLLLGAVPVGYIKLQGRRLAAAGRWRTILITQLLTGFLISVGSAYAVISGFVNAVVFIVPISYLFGALFLRRQIV